MWIKTRILLAVIVCGVLAYMPNTYADETADIISELLERQQNGLVEKHILYADNRIEELTEERDKALRNFDEFMKRERIVDLKATVSSEVSPGVNVLIIHDGDPGNTVGLFFNTSGVTGFIRVLALRSDTPSKETLSSKDAKTTVNPYLYSQLKFGSDLYNEYMYYYNVAKTYDIKLQHLTEDRSFLLNKETL